MNQKNKKQLIVNCVINNRINAAILNLSKQVAFKMRQIHAVKKLSKMIGVNK